MAVSAERDKSRGGTEEGEERLQLGRRPAPPCEGASEQGHGGGEGHAPRERTEEEHSGWRLEPGQGPGWELVWRDQPVEMWVTFSEWQGGSVAGGAREARRCCVMALQRGNGPGERVESVSRLASFRSW